MMSRLLAVYFLGMLFGATEAFFFRRICEGKSSVLFCHSGQVIDILRAFYGRTQRGLCGHLDRNTNCRAQTPMRVVRYKCQNQHSCVLYAKNSEFGDPCKGTQKYLEVTYRCVHPARPQSVLRICEGRSRTLRCKRGTSINIIQANYGRLTGGQICPGQIKTTYCRAALSLVKVNTACQRKLQCFLRATNSIYGDPCKGTRKYLEVRYRCA